MNSSKKATTLLQRVIKKTGGFYLILAVALAQMASNIVAIPITWISQVNAELTSAQALQVNQLTLILTIAGNIIIWVSTFIRNRTAFQRLQQWKRGKTLVSGNQDELQAWRQVTSLAWNYAFVASFTALVVIVIPLQAYQINNFKLTADQITYTLFGGILSMLSIITLDVMVMEWLLTPARVILTPREFNDQLTGRAGVRIFAKTLLFILAITGMGMLLVAPIGYHQTYKVLYQAIGSINVLRDLRVQSILVSVLGIAVGAIISYLLSASISNPIRRMIDVFQKIERGDLKQRLAVTATDELGELTVYFNRMVSRLEELQGTLEQQVNERTAQLTATLEVGRIASQILDQEELITTVVNLITDKFDYYFAAIYLLNSSNQWAELKAATGEAGKLLLESKYRLGVNEKSMVGATAKSKDTRVAFDVRQEASHLENPLLPYTRSELTLPLISGSHILGVLDVQSTEVGGFNTSDIETLQGMANQLTVALENARLFQETQQTLDEVRSVHRQYLTQAWGRVTENREIQFTTGDKALAKDAAEIDVPLTLRDQIIGELVLEGDNEWSTEERALIEAVATQAALALENARLIEESQQLAVRERLISEIGAKIWASTTVDSILQTAVREIGRIMNATEAVIEIDLEQTTGESA